MNARATETGSTALWLKTTTSANFSPKKRASHFRSEVEMIELFIVIVIILKSIS